MNLLKRLSPLAAGVALAAPLIAVELTPAPAAPADKAIAEIRAITAAPMTLLNDPAAKTASREQREAWFAAGSELVAALGEKFLRDHPQDPRRWEAIRAILGARREFAGADAEARKTEWEKRRAALVAQIIADRSAAAEAVMAAASAELTAAIQGARLLDEARARAALALLAERAPDAPVRQHFERMFLEALHQADPAAALARAVELERGSETAIAGTARNWRASVEFKTKPLDLKFPDLDGRELDLAQYRGKVVLLDFWATWCVPCMEQMPHLVEVYEKYHARGFEVIGITDDIPVRDPAKPRPVEKTVETLKAFLDKHQMPWPQLWDTRVQKNPAPKALLQQFGIRSLPTYLLFDQNGMFVTADLRGEKLEAEVKRLLGQ